jgi:hypothetical protein
MPLWIGLLFLASQPFWETKPPEQWTDHEIDLVLISSPWTQTLSPAPSVLAWFATAQPIEEAETEARLHKRHPLRQLDPDYTSYVAGNRDRVFVLAIEYASLKGLSKESDLWKRLESETEMHISGKVYKLEGLFPPEPSDPVLRLIFPRAVKPSDKSVRFQLYLPGLPFPEREAEFFIKDLIYHGKLAM